jgi:hypothetical protein
VKREEMTLRRRWGELEYVHLHPTMVVDFDNCNTV